MFFSVVLYFSMSFPPIYVASAIAANNLLRYTLASVFPLFTVQCFENLGIGWAGSLFAFIALAMVPVPYVFGYFGPHLRARSKFGYAAYFKKLEEQKELQAAADAKRKTQIEHKNNLLIVPLSNLKCHQNPRKLLLKKCEHVTNNFYTFSKIFN